MVDYAKMPRDLAELYTDFAVAHESGNTSLAQTISNRIAQIEQYERDVKGPDPSAGMSTVDKLRTGFARGMLDVGQGIKQKALMVGEGLGVVPEGRAQEYSNEVTDEIRRFEEGMPGIGAESVGRFAGWAAPGALIPGTGAGALIVGGALEAGVMPTEQASWTEAAKNATIGAATGGALKGAGTAYRAVRPKVTPEAEAALGYAAEKNIKMRPQHVNTSQYHRQGGNIADLSPFNPSGKRVLEDARGQIEELRNRYGVADLQDEYVRGLDNAREAEGAIWNQAERAFGSKPVNTDPIYQNILKEIDRLEQTGDPGNQIPKLAALWERLPQGKNGKVSWSDLKEFRSNFSEANAKAFGTDSMSSGIIDRMYSTITKEMERVAEESGPASRALFDKAVDATKNRRNLVKQARIPYDVGKGTVRRQELFETILKGKDADRIDALSQLITAEGKESAKNFIANQIVEAATRGQRIVGPGSAAQKIRQMMPAIEKMFSPDEAAEMRGMMHFMDAIKNEAATFANAPTGERVLSLLNPALVLKTVLKGGKDIAGVVGTMGLAPWLFRRRDAAAMLRKLSKVDEGSPLYNKLVQELITISNQGVAGAAAENNPMTIEIKNGRTQ